MPEACPDPALLAAWSEGRVLEGSTAEAVERHLGECPRCGDVLEGLTRARLGSMDLGGLRRGCGRTGSDDAARDHGVVTRLIQSALVGTSATAGDPLPDFIAGLEAPSRDGCLGRFAGHEIEESIGRGGMGVVFRAFDPTLRRRVALKVLLHERRTSGNAAAAECFLSEARAIAALRHEHVVEVYSAGRENGWPFLVMPFHDQGTLQRWIDEGRPVTPAEAALLGVQLLRALEFTHSRGILHRDLKPSNVLLERGLDHVRLADFGLAQAVPEDPSGTGRVVVGTPDFMSPEQSRGERLDARSDLYGLGALLCSLLSGPVSRAEVGEGEPESGPILPSGVPGELRAFLARLLAPRAEDRPPDAVTARQALEDLIPRLAGPSAPPRTSRRLASLVGVLVAMLAILVGLEWSGRTAVVNALLCQATGNGYFVQGRWGTHAELAAAAGACRPGDLVVARFNGEQPVAPLRVGPRGLRVRAAAGFLPAIVSTNAEEALILALGPVVLEGLTLISRGDSGDGGQLIAAEGAPIRLVHCRLLRLRAGGDDVLVRSGRRLDPDQSQLVYKPLLALRSGSSAELRSCVVAGLAATGIGLRCHGAEPIHVEIDRSLFAIHRGFVLRPEFETHVTIRGRDSAFASASLVEVENAHALGRLAVGWERCFLDRTGGVLLRWSRGGDGSWLDRMTWTETNVVYAGSGAFAWDRRRGSVATEAEWNRLVGLPEGSHRSTFRPLFGEIRVRSSRRLEAADVDVAGLAADAGIPTTFRPDEIGTGPAYERFREGPE